MELWEKLRAKHLKVYVHYGIDICRAGSISAVFDCCDTVSSVCLVQAVPVSATYPEPIQTVRFGTTGNSARWVQWCLWRFGLLEKSGIDGVIVFVSLLHDNIVIHVKKI